MANFILNGKVYGSDSGGGGGGTTVIANPSGTATDTLIKLQVDNDIYGVSGGGGGSSDLDAVELTKAQYDALTPEQKADTDKIYFITDYNPPSGGGSWDYSTTKVDTGQKWIDGRTIYCKVYTWQTQITNIGNNSWKNLDIPSNDENWNMFINVIGGNQVGVVWNFLSLNYDNANYLQVWNPRSAAIQLKWLAVWFVENNVGE